MSKDSSFRTCIALLLAIQAACWALTLLDLYSPGKPLSLLRSSTNLFAQLFSRRTSGLLSYKDIHTRT
ncbi:hypothetical protein BU26DRAFT_523137 [Trematosphaeria pertusa]|uniref:Uncharacterized protein n=1 Tax=Trematosphaeria pertusa TaxID=390896 RepID=A0A6A6I4F5_9PLEO|nr:uncharacterized protein BU26DRAFT_523137 [Trematosphaeria pertusa]KAF2244490.1 hypothetical protein BU26DRAFT_523137 [Trematosphaeria pertusa]